MTPERWRKVEQVYHKALQQPTAVRAAFVVAACGDDADLHREVESLLDAGSADDGRLDSPAWDGAEDLFDDAPVRAPLKSGEKLGGYEILAPLGAGGMGEVYRAFDSKLNREVAIKILPKAFARHVARVERLKREARVLASLNHPNIAVVYDFQEVDGSFFLVLEYVPGQSLSARLKRGPIAMREGFTICKQVAEALEAAHDKGVIHRDLKPANIMVTPEGRVKLLDFGIAKTNRPRADSATITELTGGGVVLGTVAYMSPEQARGLTVDRRSDIWSFGCVLFEVLTGRRLFGGPTSSDVIAAILRDELSLDALPEATPSGVRKLLERCLRQSPAERLRDIGDARLEIEEAMTAPTAERRALPPTRVSRWMWLAAGVLLGAAAVSTVWWGRRPSSGPPADLRVVALTDWVGQEESPAISPDGKIVAFVSGINGRRQIWIRLLEKGAPLQVTHDDADHLQPRWTPDSSSLIYYVPSAATSEQGTIWELPYTGGSPQRVASALNGGDVSHDGRRIALFQLHEGRIELTVMARGGTEAVHRQPMPGISVFEHPRWSPDDRTIAFTRGSSDRFDEAVLTTTPDGGDVREVAHSDYVRGVSWLPDGSGLVFGSSTGSTVLYPPTFNLRIVSRSGSGERALTFGEDSYVDPDIHSLGKVFAVRARSRSDIWAFPLGGAPEENSRAAMRITHQTGQVQTPSVSPDGTEIVYLSNSGGHGNLWAAKTDGTQVRQITFWRDPGVSIGVPIWAPMGRQIVFIVTQGGRTGEWLVNSDATGLRELIKNGSAAVWSPDAQWVYYQIADEDTFCIEKAPVNGGNAQRVRCDRSVPLGLTADGTLYYATQNHGNNGGWDFDIRKANPETAEGALLGRVSGLRVPVSAFLFAPVLSHNGSRFALPLRDGGTADIWTLGASGGEWKRNTAFPTSTLIVRRVSWAPDDRRIYAALAETDADIVMFISLLR
jgi:serine/threonine protein kinase/Tol biopolymer transport system component